MSKEGGWFYCTGCERAMDDRICYCLNCNELVEECDCSPAERLWPGSEEENADPTRRRTKEGVIPTDK